MARIRSAKGKTRRITTSKVEKKETSPGKIGKQVENLMKSFLTQLSFDAENPSIFAEELSLMKSGDQFGLDLNWAIRFALGSTKYNWFFEAKGKGFKEYHKKSSGGNKTFTLDLIAEKLIQIAASFSDEPDCWCLFAPYIKLDKADLTIIKNLQTILPFSLLIWDRDHLMIHSTFDSALFAEIYPREAKKTHKVGAKDQMIQLVKEASIAGRFQHLVHAYHSKTKKEIVDRCEQTIVFQSDIPFDTRKRRYYFIYRGEKYEVPYETLRAAVVSEPVTIVIPPVKPSPIKQKDEMKIADAPPSSRTMTVGPSEPKLDSLRRIFWNAKGKTTHSSLAQEFGKYLNKKNVPFLLIEIRHKFDEFIEHKPIQFYLLNSSTYFGTAIDKPIYFRMVKDYVS